MIFSGVPWPFLLPLVVFAMVWGVMVSKAEVRRQEQKRKGIKRTPNTRSYEPA